MPRFGDLAAGEAQPGVWSDATRPAGADLTQMKTNQEGTETAATFTQTNDTNENTVFTDTGVTRRKVHNIYLDLATLTQSATIRLYVRIDGATFRECDRLAWTTADEDGVIIGPFTTNEQYRITIQSAVGEGATRAIPHARIVEEMET